MPDFDYWAPHETRVFALQVAVEYINGDSRRGNHYTKAEVLAVAETFEEWLTRPPRKGFEMKPDDKAA